jgi:rRNA maturation protein Nop10
MSKYVCEDCGSEKVQVCLPAWFDPNKNLKMVDIDDAADELSTYCEECGDTTGVIAPNGKVIRGRWD